MGETDYMIVLMRGLKAWLPRIKKSTYATEVALSGGINGIYVTVRWAQTKAGPAGEHTVALTRAVVLGRTANAPVLKQRPLRRTCRITASIIQEVLAKRGVR